MNYLAHLLLAGDDPGLTVGALLGDFVRPRQIPGYSDPIQAGIRLHVQIDVFTDAHPVVARSKARMRRPYRRYAAVLADIFYDHFLAHGWGSFTDAGCLEEFAEDRYRVLLDHRPLLPPRLQRIVPVMAQQDWLTRYRDLDAVDKTLQRLAGRLKRSNPLPHAICMLEENYVGLKSDFEEFFPQLDAFAETARREYQRQARNLKVPPS